MYHTWNYEMKNIDKLTITLKKLAAIVIDDAVEPVELERGSSGFARALTLNAEMMNLGFVLSEALFAQLSLIDEAVYDDLSVGIIQALKKMVGDDVQYTSFYPNFPRQLIEADDVELYFNAVCHYWSNGEWLPSYEKLPRQFAFEKIKYKQIDVANNNDFLAIFTRLLSSNDSLCEEDKRIIEWFSLNVAPSLLVYPETMPFAENKCIITALQLTKGHDIAPLVKTATDILRAVTYLSGGDVSLADNTKFISLPRIQRKALTKALETVINEEDIGRHRRKWVKLFHCLHVGDYSAAVYAIAQKARNKGKLKSFNGSVEALLKLRDVEAAVALLATRPGEFGRRLDQLLRLSVDNQSQHKVAQSFLRIVEKIPTRNLLQLLGHLGLRSQDLDKKIVFPKGNVQRAVVVRKEIVGLNAAVVALLVSGIRSCLILRFSAGEDLGKVWLDPELMDCPIPTQQRSASSGLFSVARGTRLPISFETDTAQTLRFFIYWIGRDIDLSATFHDERFGILDHVSYTRLRSRGYKAFHSGDITNAPYGASEFIDITLDAGLKNGARYLAMNVLVYNGPNFSEHKTCYAGWMTRSKPNSNEVYEPKTVQQKIDVTSACRNVIPVVFDLRDKKVIWVDVATSEYQNWGVNNVESNAASIEEKLEAAVTIDHKVSLYELFELHALSRGHLVESRDEADTVFSVDQGITPYSINEINAQYVG